MKHESLTLQITKLNCGSCVARAEKAVRDVEGVSEVAVNLASETATVVFDSPATLATITDALETAGYPAAEEQITFDIELRLHTAAFLARHGVAELAFRVGVSSGVRFF